MIRNKAVIAMIAFGLIASLSAVVLAISIRHDKRCPSQSCGRYVAVRTIESWSLLGHELYARNTLGVYDSAIKEEPGLLVTQTLPARNEELPEPIGELSIQIRRGGVIESGDDQFMLGEREGSRKEECIAYIINVLAKSSNRQHRLYAASSLWVARGDLVAKALEGLLADPDEEIRESAMKHSRRQRGE